MAAGDGVDVLKHANLSSVNFSTGTDGTVTDLGVVSSGGEAGGGDFTKQFIAAIAQHRFWDRPDQDQVPLT